MSKEISITNIKNFIEGNVNQALSSLDLKPDSFMEQVRYRKSICTDCMEAGVCNYCGCSVPGRLYTTSTCNKGERFPDIMGDEEWAQFKKDNYEKFHEGGTM